MSQPIKIVAQQAMDDFLQNYRVPTDFFTLSDFISRCGDAVADYYNQGYKQQYDLYRSEKKDDVVAFGSDALNVQVLKTELKDGVRVAKLQEGFMSFPYDQQNIGIQNIFPAGSTEECVRTNLNQLYVLKYIPGSTNRVFWYLIDKETVAFISKGECNGNSVNVYYVPAIGPDMNVPDGIARWVIDTTVMSMKQKAQGVIVKESLDQNSNKTIETEVDKLQLK